PSGGTDEIRIPVPPPSAGFLDGVRPDAAGRVAGACRRTAVAAARRRGPGTGSTGAAPAAPAPDRAELPRTRGHRMQRHTADARGGRSTAAIAAPRTR